MTARVTAHKLAGIAALLSMSFIGPHRAGAQEASSTRESFLRTIERPRAPLAPTPPSVTTESGYHVERLTIASEPGERVPLLVYRKGERPGGRPVVLVLHGTGGNKESMGSLLATLADSGFVAVAMDARHHGERAVVISGLQNSYENAMLRAFRTGEGHPYLYDTVWDVMRVVDYLVSRADIDASRLGVVGLSKGGTEAYLAAAADPRITAVVPLIGVQSFAWSLQHPAAWEARVWTFRSAVEASARDGNEPVDGAFVKKFYERIAPGLIDRFDGPAMLPLIAPRAMLVINADSDPRSPLAGVRDAVRAAEQAYRAAGVPERFSFLLEENAAHEITLEGYQGMLQWVIRWLRPSN